MIGAAIRDSNHTKTPRRPRPPPSGSSAAIPGPQSDDAEDDAGEPDRRERRAGPVDGRLPAADPYVGQAGEREHERDQRDRHDQEEDGSPRRGVDQDAAQDGPAGAGDGGDGRPGADGAAALGARKAGADERQAVRYQQGRPDALHRARGDQLRRVRREAGRDRGDGQDGEPGGEQASPAEAIAGGSGREGEGAQEERVDARDPLHLRDGGDEALLDRRQGDVDDRRLEGGDARAEDRPGEHPALRVRRASGCLGSATDHARVARRSSEAQHAAVTIRRCGARSPRDAAGSGSAAAP